MLVEVRAGGSTFPAHVDSLESGSITLPESRVPIQDTNTIQLHYGGSTLVRYLSDPERQGIGLVRWRMRTARADGSNRF